MDRSAFWLLVCLHIFAIHSLGLAKNMSSIDEDDIRAFRAKSYVKPINGLQDLDSNSTGVLEINEKIGDMEDKAAESLSGVPANATCSIKLKYYIKYAIQRAKVQCDDCIIRHLVETNRTSMNDNQKNCLLQVLEAAKLKIDELLPAIEKCSKPISDIE